MEQILIIDDAESIRNMLREILNLAGFQVI
ncbi:MAG: DNA-binding response regulator, partial [Candidatus Melainabacteria bacterium HGW-Melainabacteria-1]